MEIKSVKVIDVSDWDGLVEQTYGRPYSFQQQDGCKDRGKEYITIPDDAYDIERDTIPEIINGDIMGVTFKAWLEKDPTAPLNPTDEELKSCNYFHNVSCKEAWCTSKSHIRLFWERNFYPNVQMIANDLYAKGLIEAGDYMIDIDW